MKRYFFLCLFFWASLSLPAEENLIRNGDFLQVRTNGTPKYWSGKMDPGSGIDSDCRPPKGNSFRLKETKKGLSQRIKVEAGNAYKVSYLLKTDFPRWLTAASFQILWLDKSGKPLWKEYKGKKVWNMTIRNVQGSRDWERITMQECIAPESAAWADVSLSLAFDNAGTCWFADIAIRKVPQAENFPNRIAAIPLYEETITDSGLFHAGIWENSTVLGDFLVPATNTRAQNQTKAEIFYTLEAIYLHIICQLPGADKVRSDNKVHFSMQESCEIFLQPPGIQHQYQIFTTMDGAVRCFTETWNDGHWPMKLHPMKSHNITAQVRCTSENWEIAMKIPFQTLKRKTPVNGETWRMNVCRGNYAARQRELSAWSALREAHFQFPDDFGKIIFTRDIPLVKNIRLDGNGTTLQIRNPGYKARDISVSFVKHTSGGAWETSSTHFRVMPGELRNFSCDIPTQSADMRFLELRCAGEMIAKHCNMPNEKYYALGIFDPEGVRGKTLNIAVDHPFFIGLNMRHNAPGKTVHRLIERHEKAFDLYIEVPPGLKFNGLIFDAGEWRQSGLIKPSVTTVRRNNSTMNRYRFELPLVIHWDSPVYIFFYECSIPEGKEFSGSYYLTENGKAFPHHELHFRTLKIGSVNRMPKVFCNDMFYLDAKIIKHLFPKDTLKHYTAMGMNRITVNVQIGKNAGLYSGTSPQTREDYYDLLFREMQQTGIKLYYSSNSSSATPAAWNWTDKDKDARAVGADGKPAPYNQYNYPSLCPTYRGIFFKAHTELLKNSYLFRKYQCTWLTLDLELWPKETWDKLCFCKRCLKEFRIFAKERKSPYANCNARKKFLDGTDAGFMNFWEEYKSHIHTRFIRDLTDPVKAASVAYPSSSPRKDFLIAEWCKPRAHLLDCIDLFELGLYYTPNVVRRHFEEIYQKWGDRKKNWYPTFTFGQTVGCPDFHMKAEQLSELIYEAAVYGAQGICWFHYQYAEPLRMKYVIQGLNHILPFEDLVVNGEITSEISVDNQAMQLTARQNGNEGLIAIRAYQSSTPQRGRIVFRNLNVPSAVFDCISRKQIAELTPQKSVFEYTVEGNRCRLLYFGSKSRWNARVK